MPGAPRRSVDIAFPTEKVAVFVMGCFWHRCALHGTLPKANRQWWCEKLSKNAERDQRSEQMLRELGWLVINVWEHDAPDDACSRIVDEVELRRFTGKRSWS